jgi:hypothetical protein
MREADIVLIGARGAPILYRVYQTMATKGRKFDQPNPFSDGVDREIYEAHRRFVEVMEEHRLGSISAGTKAQYLHIMQTLAEKLAVPSKPLAEIVGEVMSEAAPLLFAAMQR